MPLIIRSGGIKKGLAWYSQDSEVSFKQYYSQLMLEAVMQSLNPLS